jgi:hypothetical protein
MVSQTTLEVLVELVALRKEEAADEQWMQNVHVNESKNWRTSPSTQSPLSS